MKIFRNRFIPWKGYVALNACGILFVRSEYNKELSPNLIRHETIHTKQMQEMGYILFYLWYVIEWFCKLFVYHNSHKAYRNISFEREAYGHEREYHYLEVRKHYNWLRLVWK